MTQDSISDPLCGSRRSSTLDARRSVVVVIDLQGRLMEMVYRPELLRSATQRLLEIAALFDVPVVVTEQYPQGLGPTEDGILAVVEQLETATRRITKESFSCAREPAFESAVAELLPDVAPSSRQYVIAGIEAHICVSQTALHLLEQGSEVHLCWECVSGRGEEVRRHALERLAAAGAILTHHETVAFEWAGDKNHLRFRDLNRLLRDGQIA